MNNKAVLISVIFLLSASQAHAQELSEDARQQLISQNEAFQDEIKKDSLREAEKPEISVEKETDSLSDTSEGPRFFIKKINIDGSTVFLASELEPYAAPYEQKESSFGELKSLLQHLTNHYRSRGYVTSRAYIPPQTVENGIVTVQIAEGKIGDISVEGHKYFSADNYRRMLNLRRGEIFRYQNLETALIYLNELPDRSARAYLIAGKDPATSDIILKVIDKRPAHVSYEFNNRGTKLTHRARHLIGIDHNNLLGQSDDFHAVLSMAEEGAFDALAADYNYPLNSRTSFGITGSYAQSKLVKHLKPFDVKGKAFNITPSVTQNFIRSSTFTFDGYAGFEIKDSKTLVGDLKTSYDRTRVLLFGPRLTFRDRFGKTLLNGDIHWGIPKLMGGLKTEDPNASRPGTGGNFIYFTESIARLHRLPWSTYAVFRSSAQWSPKSLVSLEQFRAGGAYSVRGYPEADAAGDSGYTFSAEWNTPVPFLPENRKLPGNQKWRDALRLIGFLDGGQTFLHRRTAASDVKNKFLLGAGFGVRLNVGENLSVKTDIAWPIGDESSDKDRPQVHLSSRVFF